MVDVFPHMKDVHDYDEYLMLSEAFGMAPEPEEQFRIVTAKLFPRGAGDTAAVVFHSLGIDRVAKVYTEVTGKDCGCNRRQNDWNNKLPYGDK